MGTRNWPLYLGMALALVFVSLAIVGPALAPHDPLEMNLYLKTEERIYMAPLAPFELPSYPLGTDEAGRDVLSRILWGIRPTLVLCVAVAVARLAVGVVVGLLGGWFRGSTERVVDAVGSIGVGLPALVLAIGLINFLGVERGLLTFVIALTLVGWIEVANLVKAQTLTVVHAPYVEAARALGVKPLGVLRRHLLPQLRPLLPILLAFELSAALLLVTELGFLGIYIGGGVAYEADVGGNYSRGPIALTANYPELGQQIARFWTKFYRVPWEFVAVGAVIFAQIVAFNLVGEGLRRRFDVTQPRQRRWLRLPDAVLDRMPQLGWRWVPVGALLAAMVVGAYVYAQGRSPTAPPLEAAASAASSTPTFSDTPLSVDQLRTVDLDGLLAQPALLPAQMTIGQVSGRVPDQFRTVPPPVQARNFTVYKAGLNGGNIAVLLYASVDERNNALQTMAKVIKQQYDEAQPPDRARVEQLPAPDQLPLAGEQSFSFTQRSGETVFVPQPQQVVFVRCSALVQVQVGNGARAVSEHLQEPLPSIIKALDAQLAPHVCQP